MVSEKQVLFWTVAVICPALASKKINGHIIVSSFYNPLARIANGTTYDVGRMEKYFYDIASTYLNFTYEVRPPRDVLAVGSIANGTGTGVIGQLIRKEVDVCVTGTELTLDLAQFVDGSVPVTYDTVDIMIHYPKKERKTNALFAIYSPTVWIFIIAAITTVVFVLRLAIAKLEPAQERDSLMLLMVGVIAFQGNYVRYQHFATRITWATWILVLVVLVNVYTGTLTSMLSAPSFVKKVDSIEDIANNHRIKPYSIKGSPTVENIMASPLPAYRAVRDRFLADSNLLLTMSSDMVSKVAQDENNVLLASNVLTSSFIVQDRRREKRCRFTVAKNSVHSRKLSMLLQKNSPWTEHFNYLINLMHSGLLMRFNGRFTPDPRICAVTKEVDSKRAPLHLEQLTEAFVLLFAGLIASFILLVASLRMATQRRIRQ